MAVSNGGIEVIIIIGRSFAFAFPKATVVRGGSGSHFNNDRQPWGCGVISFGLRVAVVQSNLRLNVLVI